jgi:hypothetical protein
VQIVDCKGVTVMETSTSASGKSLVYSDTQLTVAVASRGTTQPSAALSEVPGDLSFTSLEDPWFLWLSKVCVSPLCDSAVVPFE